MNYSDEVIERFRLLEKTDFLSKEIGIFLEADSEDRSLGVWVRCQMLIFEELIKKIGFSIYGCPDTLASAHKVQSILQNKTIHDIEYINMYDIRVGLSIPVAKMGNILVIENTLKQCLGSYLEVV